MNISPDLDINQLFKIGTIVFNVIIGFTTIIIFGLSIFSLVEYIYHDECGVMIIYILGNGIFLPLALVLNFLGICAPCFDKNDFFGTRSILILLATFPIYLADVIMGSYLYYKDQEAITCIQKEKTDNFMLFFTFTSIYYYSIFATIIELIAFIIAHILNRTLVVQYRNSPAIVGRNGNITLKDENAFLLKNNQNESISVTIGQQQRQSRTGSECEMALVNLTNSTNSTNMKTSRYMAPIER
jgi:hypothetical protein